MSFSRYVSTIFITQLGNVLAGSWSELKGTFNVDKYAALVTALSLSLLSIYLFLFLYMRVIFSHWISPLKCEAMLDYNYHTRAVV